MGGWGGFRLNLSMLLLFTPLFCFIYSLTFWIGLLVQSLWPTTARLPFLLHSLLLSLFTSSIRPALWTRLVARFVSAEGWAIPLLSPRYYDASGSGEFIGQHSPGGSEVVRQKRHSPGGSEVVPFVLAAGPRTLGPPRYKHDCVSTASSLKLCFIFLSLVDCAHTLLES